MTKRKILIVEDDLIVARSIENHLKILGYDVAPPVDNGVEALRQIAETPPDLVLMDIRLKGELDGVQTAEQIRAVSTIPLVYTTAYADKETVERAKITTPFGYLVKPFGVKELSSVIEIAFYKYQMEQQVAHLNLVLRAIRNVNQLITQEKDVTQLLSRACECLVETRGYHSVWVVTLNAERQVLQAHQAGVPGNFEKFIAGLRQGEIPACWQHNSFASAIVQVVDDVTCTCVECAFPPQAEETGRLLARLEHNAQFYGMITVTLPQELTRNIEELDLFQELAGDIAFALHTIEAEEERQHATQRLQESETRFRTLVNSMDDLVFTLDLQQRYTGVYGNWPETEALTLDEFIGKTPRDIWDTEIATQHAAANQRALAGERVTYEWTLPDVYIPRTYQTVLSPLYDEDGDVIGLVGVGRDITEQLEAQHALKTSESKHRGYIEHAPYGIFVADAQGNYVQINPAASQITGYTEAELLKMAVTDLIPLEAYEAALGHFAQVKREGYAKGEFPFVHKDGSIHYKTVSAVQLNAERFLGFTEDITERKRTQEELYEIFTMSLDMICIADINTNRFLKVNPAFSRTLGYTEEELLASSFLDFAHPDDVAATAAIVVEKLQRGEKVINFENRYRRKNGSYCWINWVSHPIPERGITYAIARDVTFRREAEEQLRVSEVRYRSTFEQAAVGMSHTALDGQLLRVNDRLCEITGYPREELLTLKFQDITYAEDLDTDVSLVNRMLVGEIETYALEKRYVHKTGAPVWVNLTVSLLRDEAGTPVYFISVIEDINMRKRAEQHLVALNEAARAMEAVLSPAAIFMAVAETLQTLGMHCAIYRVEAPQQILSTQYASYSATELARIETLTGIQLHNYHVSIADSPLYDIATNKQSAIFIDDGPAMLRDIFPPAIHSVIETLCHELNAFRFIVAPLSLEGYIPALFAVLSDTLREEDLPAVTAFANQVAAAWHKAELYQSLQEREATLSSILSAAPIGIGLVIDRIIKWSNEGLQRMLGYTAAELDGQSSQRLYPCQEEFERVGREKYALITQYGTGGTETQFQCKDGRILDILLRSTPLNPQNLLEGVTFTALDITERKSAEAALRESEARYRGIFEQAAVGISHAGLDGRFIRVNQQFCTMLGYTHEEMLTLHYHEITPPEDQEPDRLLGEQLLRGEIQTFSLEKRYIHKNGSLFWVNITVSLQRTFSGAPEYYIAIIEDITERKLAEAALRQSEARYRQLFKEMLNGFALHEIICDAHGKPMDYRYLEVNPAFEKILGLHVEEIVGKTVLELLPNTEPYWIEQFGTVALLGEPKRFENYSQSLERYYAVSAFSPQLGQFAVVVEDVTERKRAEDNLTQRAYELQVLNQAGQVLTESLDLQETLHMITFHITNLLVVEATSLVLLDKVQNELCFAAASGVGADVVLGQCLPADQGIIGWVVQHGEPLWVPDVSQDPRWFDKFDQEANFVTRSILCVPLRTKDGIIGAMEAINKERGTFTQEDVWLLSSLAGPAATAIENAQLFEQLEQNRIQLQDLSRWLVEMQEAERAHIARELHDETGQILSYFLLRLSMLEREAHQPEAIVARAQELVEMTEGILEGIHRLAMNLRPADLDVLGLVATLERHVAQYQQQHGITAQFETLGLGHARLPEEMETALYRIAQEALTNVARHAQATQVDVLLTRRDGLIVLIVEDNGIGFATEEENVRGRLGLLGMRERARMLGGNLIIESRPEIGTTIAAEVPYAPADSDR